VKKFAWHFFAVVLCAAYFAGCQVGSGRGDATSIITPEELSAAQAQAAKLNRPLILLVTDSGNGATDSDAYTTFASRRVVQTADEKVVTAWLDLSVSRARATAARFRPLETPLLICLSPDGIIISRETGSMTESLISDRMQRALAQSPALDIKLDQLRKAAGNKNNTTAQMQLADFLMERNNAFEAIPVLALVAHSDAVDAGLRIRAWAELGQAHLWVGEAEKAHFEAQELMATLGPVNPEARAAGNLVLGNQDAANPKRFPRARKEFEAAIAAAPDSTYGKQAAVALADLPKANSIQ
jgi:hypothetical protein